MAGSEYAKSKQNCKTLPGLRKDKLEDQACNIYFIYIGMTYICFSTFVKDFKIAENEHEFISHLAVSTDT